MPKLKYRTTSPRPDDPDILESITKSQHLGRSVRVTASNAQMGTTTLVDWLQTGRAELAAFDAGQVQELGSHGLFAAQYERAASERESILTDAITASITDSKIAFVPALISLKARNPADWVEKSQVQVESKVSITVTTLPALAEAEVLALIEQGLSSGVKLLPPTK